MSTRKSYQGGSILTFVVVGVVLLGLLGAGLFTLNKYAFRGQVATSDSGSSQTAVKNSDDKSSDASKNSASSLPGETSENSTATKSDNSASSSSATSAESNSSALPQTGSADTATQLIALGMLTFAFISYLRSRQATSFDSTL